MILTIILKIIMSGLVCSIVLLAMIGLTWALPKWIANQIWWRRQGKKEYEEWKQSLITKR